MLLAAANSSVQIFTAGCQFVALRFVPPDQLGIWQAALVINIYLSATQLGVTSAFCREYPFLNTQGDADGAAELLRTSHGWNLLNGLLLTAVFVAMGIVHWSEGWAWRVGFIAMAIQAPLGVICNYRAAVLRSKEQFALLSRIRFAEVPLALALPIGGWLYGFTGYCGGQLLMALGSLLLLRLWFPLRLPSGLNRASLKLLLATGIRLYVRNYVLKLVKAMPQSALGMAGGAVLLGLFAPVLAMVNMIQGISLSIESYMIPKLTAQVARGQNEAGKTAVQTSMVVMLAMLPIAVVGTFILPEVVRIVLPAYTDAGPAIPFALFAGVARCGMIAQAIFPATKAWRPMYIHTAVQFIIEAGCVIAGVMIAENRLVGVVCGTLVSALLQLVPTWMLALYCGRHFVSPPTPQS